MHGTAGGAERAPCASKKDVFLDAAGTA